jgi:type IV secretion system protein VirD4
MAVRSSPRGIEGRTMQLHPPALDFPEHLVGVHAEFVRQFGTAARVKQLFGTSDLHTAKELSELMGDTTVYSNSVSSGKSLDSAGVIGKGKNVGDSASEKGRRLVTPDEVLTTPNAKQILQVRGHRPVYADKLSYLEMPEVRGLYSPNPMY